LAEEIRFKDAIQLLEVPVPFSSPRLTYVVSACPTGFEKLLSEDLGIADEVDGIAALLTVCNIYISTIVIHIYQRYD
jgi:hypothetical protein